MEVNYRSPEELKKLAAQNRRETRALIKRLKKKKPKNLDQIVHSLHVEAFAAFDCLSCANCCRTIGPRLTMKDIERLAKSIKMRSSDFYSRFVKTDQDGDLVFNQQPCPFLDDDNFCRVYSFRPKACREYPHTDRNRFFQILDLSDKNRETCPVVYEIFEALKKADQHLL